MTVLRFYEILANGWLMFALWINIQKFSPLILKDNFLNPEVITI